MSPNERTLAPKPKSPRREMEEKLHSLPCVEGSNQPSLKSPVSAANYLRQYVIDQVLATFHLNK